MNPSISQKRYAVFGWRRENALGGMQDFLGFIDEPGNAPYKFGQVQVIIKEHGRITDNLIEDMAELEVFELDDATGRMHDKPTRIAWFFRDEKNKWVSMQSSSWTKPAWLEVDYRFGDDINEDIAPRTTDDEEDVTTPHRHVVYPHGGPGMPTVHIPDDS